VSDRKFGSIGDVGWLFERMDGAHKDEPAPPSERGEVMLALSDKVDCRRKKDEGGGRVGVGFKLIWFRVRRTSSAILSTDERDIISSSGSAGSGSDSSWTVE
jgi:hypothetical protein